MAPLNAHPCAHFILFSISASVVTCFTSPSEDLSFNLCQQRWWRKASLLPFGSAVANMLDGCRQLKDSVPTSGPPGQDHFFYPLLCLARVMLLCNSLRGKLSVYFTHTHTHFSTRTNKHDIYFMNTAAWFYKNNVNPSQETLVDLLLTLRTPAGCLYQQTDH